MVPSLDGPVRFDEVRVCTRREAPVLRCAQNDIRGILVDWLSSVARATLVMFT